jgi:predicted aspartyl protease
MSVFRPSVWVSSMPILHLQFNDQGRTPEGKRRRIHPSQVLLEKGPCIQVTISVATSIAEQLLQQGITVPPPIPGLALIDTGASTSCIDAGIAQQLKLPVIDVVQMASASHTSIPQNVYPAVIEVVGTNIKLDVPRAIGASLASHGLSALVGRDFLKQCTFFYNGVIGEITLSI